MSFSLPPLTFTGQTPAAQQVTLPNAANYWQRMIITNDTTYDLNVTNGNDQKLISAWTKDYLDVHASGAVTVQFTPTLNLPWSLQQPDSQVFLELQDATDTFSAAMFPMPLGRLTQQPSNQQVCATIQGSSSGSFPLIPVTIPASTRGLLLCPGPTPQNNGPVTMAVYSADRDILWGSASWNNIGSGSGALPVYIPVSPAYNNASGLPNTSLSVDISIGVPVNWKLSIVAILDDQVVAISQTTPVVVTGASGQATPVGISGSVGIADGGDRTYSCAANITPAAAATDVLALENPAGSGVTIYVIRAHGAIGASAQISGYVNLQKRNALDTGGTSTTPTITQHRETDAAPKGIVRAYTANPTINDATNRIIDIDLQSAAANTQNIPAVEDRYAQQPSEEFLELPPGRALVFNLRGVTYAAFGGAFRWKEKP